MRSRPAPSGWLIAATVACAGLLIGVAFTTTSLPAAPSIAALIGLALLGFYQPALALTAVVLSLPFVLKSQIEPRDLVVPVAALAELAVIWLARQVRPQTRAWLASPADVPVAVFATATGLSLLGFGGFLEQQLLGVVEALTGFAVFFLATQSLRSRAQVSLVVAGFVAAGLLQATGTAVRVLTGVQQVSEASRVTGWLADPNHFAGFLVLVIPLVVAVGIALEPRWLTIPTGLVTLALVLALLATLSRSGWLGLLAGMLVLSALLPGRRVRLLAVTAAIIGVVLLAGLAVPIAARFAPHSTGPLEMLASRMRVWTVALTLFSQHPVFGIGLGNFAHYYPAYQTYPVGVLHAHNIVLNMAVERGLLGLAGFLAVCVALASALIRSWRRATTPLDRAIAAGMMAAFGAYFVHSMLDVSYYDYPALLAFWLFAGVAASLPRILLPAEAA